MRKFELSISADYVPEWGVTEAVREFFQNSIDEETRDSSNKMFFDYDAINQTIRIGNKHSELDIKTLLFGVTNKKEDGNMIGNHGEGYKIATVVLLRLGKTVVFQNYCRREIWRPRLVNSKRYGGIQVPTFFVDNAAVWEKVPEHSLIIEISGVTSDEYAQIRKSNLHLQESYPHRDTSRGSILDSDEYRGKIFVGGLYICEEPRLDVGVDFKPNVVRLERDRSMVNGFDAQYYVSKMIEELKDAELTKKALNSYSGVYISSYNVPPELRDEIAGEFIKEYGIKAAPASNQEESDAMKKRGYRPIIVSQQKKDVILESEVYEDVKQELAKAKENEKPLYERFCKFAEQIKGRLTEDEVTSLYEFLDEIQEIENERDGE